MSLIATADLYVAPGVLAHLAGDEVDPDNTLVEKWKAEGSLKTSASKAAKEAVAEAAKPAEPKQ